MVSWSLKDDSSIFQTDTDSLRSADSPASSPSPTSRNAQAFYYSGQTTWHEPPTMYQFRLQQRCQPSQPMISSLPAVVRTIQGSQHAVATPLIHLQASLIAARGVCKPPTRQTKPDLRSQQVLLQPQCPRPLGWMPLTFCIFQAPRRFVEAILGGLGPDQTRQKNLSNFTHPTTACFVTHGPAAHTSPSHP